MLAFRSLVTGDLKCGKYTPQKNKNQEKALMENILESLINMNHDEVRDVEIDKLLQVWKKTWYEFCRKL